MARKDYTKEGYLSKKDQKHFDFLEEISTTIDPFDIFSQRRAHPPAERYLNDELDAESFSSQFKDGTPLEQELMLSRVLQGTIPAHEKEQKIIDFLIFTPLSDANLAYLYSHVIRKNYSHIAKRLENLYPDALRGIPFESLPSLWEWRKRYAKKFEHAHNNEDVYGAPGALLDALDRKDKHKFIKLLANRELVSHSLPSRTNPLHKRKLPLALILDKLLDLDPKNQLAFLAEIHKKGLFNKEDWARFIPLCIEQLRRDNVKAISALEFLEHSVPEVFASAQLSKKDPFQSAANSVAASICMQLHLFESDFEAHDLEALIQKYALSPADQQLAREDFPVFRKTVFARHLQPISALISLGAQIHCVPENFAGDIKKLLFKDYLVSSLTLESLKSQEKEIDPVLGDWSGWQENQESQQSTQQHIDHALKEFLKSISSFGLNSSDWAAFNRTLSGIERSIRLINYNSHQRFLANSSQFTGVTPREVLLNTDDVQAITKKIALQLISSAGTPQEARVYASNFVQNKYAVSQTILAYDSSIRKEVYKRVTLLQELVFDNQLPPEFIRQALPSDDPVMKDKILGLLTELSAPSAPLYVDDLQYLSDESLLYYHEEIVRLLPPVEFNKLLLWKIKSGSDLDLIEKLLTQAHTFNKLDSLSEMTVFDDNQDNVISLLAQHKPTPQLNRILTTLIRADYSVQSVNLHHLRPVEYLARFKNTEILDLIDARYKNLSNQRFNGSSARSLLEPYPVTHLARAEALPVPPPAVPAASEGSSSTASTEAERSIIKKISSAHSFQQMKDFASLQKLDQNWNQSSFDNFYTAMDIIEALNTDLGRIPLFLPETLEAMRKHNILAAWDSVYEELMDLNELAPRLTLSQQQALQQANIQMDVAQTGFLQDDVSADKFSITEAVDVLSTTYDAIALQATDLIQDKQYSQAGTLLQMLITHAHHFKIPFLLPLTDFLLKDVQRLNDFNVLIQTKELNLEEALQQSDALKRSADTAIEHLQEGAAYSCLPPPKNLSDAKNDELIYAQIRLIEQKKKEFETAQEALLLRVSQFVESLVHPISQCSFFSQLKKDIEAQNWERVEHSMAQFSTSFDTAHQHNQLDSFYTFTPKPSTVSPNQLTQFSQCAISCAQQLQAKTTMQPLINMSEIAKFSMHLASAAYESDEQLLYSENSLEKQGFQLIGCSDQYTDPHQALDISKQGTISFKTASAVLTENATYSFENGIYKSQIARALVVSKIIDGQEVIFLAIRGSEFNDSANGYSAFGKLLAASTVLYDYLSIERHAERFRPLLESCQALAKQRGAKLVLTGHSLGGSAAETLMKNNPHPDLAFICGSPGTGNFRTNVSHQLRCLFFKGLSLIKQSNHQKLGFQYLIKLCSFNLISQQWIDRKIQEHADFIQSNQQIDRRVASLVHKDDPVPQVGALAGYNSSVSAKIESVLIKQLPPAPTYLQLKAQVKAQATFVLQNFSKLVESDCSDLLTSGTQLVLKTGRFCFEAPLHTVEWVQKRLAQARNASTAPRAPSPGLPSLRRCIATSLKKIQFSAQHAKPLVFLGGLCVGAPLVLFSVAATGLVISLTTDRASKRQIFDKLISSAYYSLNNFDNHKGTEYISTMEELIVNTKEQTHQSNALQSMDQHLKNQAAQSLQTLIEKNVASPQKVEDYLALCHQIKQSDATTPERNLNTQIKDLFHVTGWQIPSALQSYLALSPTPAALKLRA